MPMNSQFGPGVLHHSWLQFLMQHAYAAIVTLSGMEASQRVHEAPWTMEKLTLVSLQNGTRTQSLPLSLQKLGIEGLCQ